MLLWLYMIAMFTSPWCPLPVLLPQLTTMSGSPASSKDGDVVVQTGALQPKASQKSLGSLSAMTKNSEGYGTHNRGKKAIMISAERKMAPRFLFGVFLTIFM